MSEERAPYGEPMPTAGVADVAPVADALIADVTKRQDAKGLERYGQPLRTWDGRDAWEHDVLPEYVDLGRYLAKAKMQYDDVMAENRRLRGQVAVLEGQENNGKEAELERLLERVRVLLEDESDALCDECGRVGDPGCDIRTRRHGLLATIDAVLDDKEG